MRTVRFAKAPSAFCTLFRCSFSVARVSAHPPNAPATATIWIRRTAFESRARSWRQTSTRSSHRSKLAAITRLAILRRHRSTTSRWRFSSTTISNHRLNAIWTERFSIAFRACPACTRACSAFFMSRRSVAHFWKLPANTRLAIFLTTRWSKARCRFNSRHVSAHRWKAA